MRFDLNCKNLLDFWNEIVKFLVGMGKSSYLISAGDVLTIEIIIEMQLFRGKCNQSLFLINFERDYSEIKYFRYFETIPSGTHKFYFLLQQPTK